MEKAQAASVAVGGIAKNSASGEDVFARGFYKVTCLDADGNLKWEDEIENLVTNVGKVDLLDKYLAGSAYTAAFYLGLVDGGSAPTYNAADTMASHAGWTESTAYSNATRVAPTWNGATGTGGGAGTAGTGSKASNAMSFNINATATIAGTFLVTNSTKGGTTGTLYSAGSFTGGNKSVANGDTLNVTYTAQA